MLYPEKKEESTPFDFLTIQYSDRAVHIRCDAALKSYLEEPGNGVQKLSEHILQEYQRRCGSPLKICPDSLAIEILAHTYVDSFSAAISAAGSRLPAVLSRAIGQWMAKIHRHTEVIDCGESGMDGDRWIWDGLAPFKEILYWILGDRA